MRRIGFHRVIDLRQRQGIPQREEIFFHAINVQNHARRRRMVLRQESGDLRGHRAGPPSFGRSPIKAMSVVDETVERTSDQTIARTLDVVA
jgi:hypothetical protein